LAACLRATTPSGAVWKQRSYHRRQYRSEQPTSTRIRKPTAEQRRDTTKLWRRLKMGRVEDSSRGEPQRRCQAAVVVVLSFTSVPRWKSPIDNTFQTTISFPQPSIECCRRCYHSHGLATGTHWSLAREHMMSISPSTQMPSSDRKDISPG
jgi:hypothetical protein